MEPEASLTPNPADPKVLKSALKAFKKRMKVMRLDKESGKIGGPLSSGKSSGIVGINPPSQFPKEVWDALVKQGRLKYEGDGLYGLIEG
ncbi:MAG TPA: hypothetical protein VGP72_20965 [Planctomycetota bacterium]